MGLLHPELLLLGVPALAVWWRTRPTGRVTAALRLAILLLLVLALAGPYLVRGAGGRDLVVVVDRSRSMPEGATASARELVALAENERGDGDRLFVVAFGADAVLEHTSLEGAPFAGFQRTVDADGSDLAGALDTALDLIEEGRGGTVLVVSDGESNGADPIDAARRARARGVRVDVRDVRRPEIGDLAVERVEAPGEVAVGEPYTFHVWVRSDRRVEREFTLRRGDRTLSSGTRVFEPGLTRLVFRDVLDQSGIAEVEVRLGGDVAEPDRVPENDRGRGAIRAIGTPRLLVLNHDGAEDTLVRALRAARLDVDVAAPEDVRLDAVGLGSYRAVVLENVAADRLGRGMGALRDHVRDRGAGLLMTGGRASFGVGGYYLSPLEDVLPVTMELRQEHRKLKVSMSIVMDRSGSMSLPVAGGMTKMDLANEGTVETIRLLSPMDFLSVIAVDSSAHVILEQQPVQNPQTMAEAVRRVESMGGGIFVEVGLQAAYVQLDRAGPLNQHIVLFSDAADSEEPGNSVATIARLHEQKGLTLSVIALGTKSDSDAALLQALADAGGGEAHFTNDPSELPRLFAMDTMRVARSTFIEDPTTVRVLPDLFGLGLPPGTGFPGLTGYNLVYMRPGSTAGMVTTDEYQTPLFAFRYEGIGRTASFAAELGGATGEEVVGWEGFSEFFVTVARWLVGNEEPTDVFPTVRREGRDAVIAVELDREQSGPAGPNELVAVLGGEDGERHEVVLERVSEDRYEARHTLDREGVLVGAVRLGRGADGNERFVSLPPLVLPYSPEFERSPDPDRGRRLLARLARESGGEVGVGAAGVFEGERAGRAWRLATRDLVLLALLLLLVEIAGRRLSLWESVRLPRSLGPLGAWIARARASLSARRARSRPTAGPSAAPTAAASSEPAPSAEVSEPAPKVESAPKRDEGESMGSALSRARRAAGRKLDR